MKIWLATNLLIIHILRSNLMRDPIHDLLLHVSVDIRWETIEKVSYEFVIDGIWLDLILNTLDNSRELTLWGLDLDCL